MELSLEKIIFIYFFKKLPRGAQSASTQHGTVSLHGKRKENRRGHCLPTAKEIFLNNWVTPVPDIPPPVSRAVQPAPHSDVCQQSQAKGQQT